MFITLCMQRECTHMCINTQTTKKYTTTLMFYSSCMTFHGYFCYYYCLHVHFLHAISQIISLLFHLTFGCTLLVFSCVVYKKDKNI